MSLEPPPLPPNADHGELSKFDALAHRFWDPHGEFRPLHLLNPVRLGFIAEHARLAGARALDVGCGGGLLSEAMARHGVTVTGIDLAPGMVEVARLHAAEEGLAVDYRVAAAEEEARRLGLAGELPRFPIGTVRYASTERLARGGGLTPAQFHLNAVDFLARRTAVFGMTRTGKSNTVKKLVSVVKSTSDAFQLKIGQIIYDLNGEYANANQQDRGSLAEVFPDETIRYRMMPAPGFELILNNFFQQVVEGHHTLRGLIESSKLARSADVEAFLTMDFNPPRREDYGADYEFHRQSAMYQVKLAAYRAVLARAVWPLLGTRIRPVTDRTFPLGEAGQAHDFMAKTGHVGKILLDFA